MDGPAVRSGGVLIGRDGRVELVAPAGSLPEPEWAPREHVAGIVLPGLINTHTHLELTGLKSGVAPDDFAGWIRDLREQKAARGAGEFARAAEQGVRDAFAAGITTVADTGDSGAVLPALARAGGSGIVYQEVFGPDPAQMTGSLRALEDRVAELRPWQTGRVRLGVSPHAPYTVSGPLFRAVARLARDGALPLAVHLAESRAETGLVTGDEGPFAEAWRRRGIPPIAEQGTGLPPAARRSPVSWLDAHGVLGRATLCIHAIELDAGDVALLGERGAAVAHCPVSNARHGHGRAPLRRFLEAGIAVGLGTDSGVSVDRLDLFAEMRAAARLARLTPAGALALATTGAARALGLDRHIGRLAPGWYGDVAAVAARVAPGETPETALLRAGPDDVLATFVGGRPVYRPGGAA